MPRRKGHDFAETVVVLLWLFGWLSAAGTIFLTFSIYGELGGRAAFYAFVSGLISTILMFALASLGGVILANAGQLDDQRFTLDQMRRQVDNANAHLKSLVAAEQTVPPVPGSPGTVGGSTANAAAAGSLGGASRHGDLYRS